MLHERVRMAREKMGDRLFLALRPPPESDMQMARLKGTLGLHGAAVGVRRHHVTLVILNDENPMPRGMVERMMTAAASVDAPAFDICFDRIVSNGSNTCLLPSRKPTALAELGTTLRTAMARVGLPMREGWRFRPHVTLLYRSGQHFSRTIAPITWRAESIVLIHSHVGLTRHDRLGEWRLREQAMLL